MAAGVVRQRITGMRILVIRGLHEAREARTRLSQFPDAVNVGFPPTRCPRSAEFTAHEH